MIRIMDPERIVYTGTASKTLAPAAMSASPARASFQSSSREPWGTGQA